MHFMQRPLVALLGTVGASLAAAPVVVTNQSNAPWTLNEFFLQPYGQPSPWHGAQLAPGASLSLDLEKEQTLHFNLVDASGEGGCILTVAHAFAPASGGSSSIKYVCFGKALQTDGALAQSAPDRLTILANAWSQGAPKTAGAPAPPVPQAMLSLALPAAKTAGPGASGARRGLFQGINQWTPMGQSPIPFNAQPQRKADTGTQVDATLLPCNRKLTLAGTPPSVPALTDVTMPPVPAVKK